MLCDYSYFGFNEFCVIVGIGEMFDILLVYENFLFGEVVGIVEFVVNGVMFCLVVLESLLYFLVIVVVYCSIGEFMLLVEVFDGVLGMMVFESFGRWVLVVLQCLVSWWDWLLCDVDILLDGEYDLIVFGLLDVMMLVFVVYIWFVEIVVVQFDLVVVSWVDGQLMYWELDVLVDWLVIGLCCVDVSCEILVVVVLFCGLCYVVVMLVVFKVGGMIVLLDLVMFGECVVEILCQILVLVVIDEGVFVVLVGVDIFEDDCVIMVLVDQVVYVIFIFGIIGILKGVIGIYWVLLVYVDDYIECVLWLVVQWFGCLL